MTQLLVEDPTISRHPSNRGWSSASGSWASVAPNRVCPTYRSIHESIHGCAPVCRQLPHGSAKRAFTEGGLAGALGLEPRIP